MGLVDPHTSIHRFRPLLATEGWLEQCQRVSGCIPQQLDHLLYDASYRDTQSVYPFCTYPLAFLSVPTALDRVQVLLQPKVYAQLKTLAKHNKHSLSRMAAELVVHAMSTPTFKAQLEEAAIKFPPKQDPRIGAPQAQFREEITQAAVDGADLNKPEIKRLLSALLSQLEEQDDQD